MGDFWAHINMKECCQEALTTLDRVRDADHRAARIHRRRRTTRDAHPPPTLLSTLGSLTIPKAKTLTEQLHISQSDLVLVSTNGEKVWHKVASEHRATHVGAGETREAKFWDDLLEPHPFVDLTLSLADYRVLFDRSSGTSSFSLGGSHDPPGQDILKRIQEATGNRLSADSKHGLLIRAKTLKSGEEVWFGTKPQLSTKSWGIGVSFELKFR